MRRKLRTAITRSDLLLQIGGAGDFATASLQRAEQVDVIALELTCCSTAAIPLQPHTGIPADGLMVPSSRQPTLNCIKTMFQILNIDRRLSSGRCRPRCGRHDRRNILRARDRRDRCVAHLAVLARMRMARLYCRRDIRMIRSQAYADFFSQILIGFVVALINGDQVKRLFAEQTSYRSYSPCEI